MRYPNALAIVALSVVAAGGCGVRGSSVEATATAHYLANEGVLVTNGETKIAFDPLFRNDFGQYQLLTAPLERALFAGEPPFDGLDAVFISHYHEDHFSAADILRLLERQPKLELYAPEQAVSQIKAIAPAHQQDVFARVNAIGLAYQDNPVTMEAPGLLVEAVRIPHSGWPSRSTDVENLAFRVTLDRETTVVHLGDADTSDVHYAHDDAYWASRPSDMAFPPYWYFGSDEGRAVLDERLRATHSVGVHVPVSMRDGRPAELEGYDLFLEPGETRLIRR